MADGPSDKSRSVALLLAFFLGMFGGHRFYAGRPETGALMLITLGGLGLWWLYDLILVAAGGFRDGDNRLITRWDPESEATALAGVPAEVLEELDALRLDVAEIAERMDFTERLLARPSDPEPVFRPRE